MPADVAARLPLPTLLSQALIAFTIELDNEFEHRMPHSTTRHGSSLVRPSEPWLASMAMWSTCMRFVREKGTTVRELRSLARTGTNLDGMRRWGYIVIEPGPGGKPSKQPRPDSVLRPTAKGRMAQEVWRPLFTAIELRWEERFGKREIDRLRESLRALTRKIDFELPDCLPILGYGLFSKDRDTERRATSARDPSVESLALPALLSRALLAFAIEFERESDLSLAICANVMRVLDDNGVKVRDLPLSSGVSKEAISMATGYLQKRGFILIEPDPSSSRTKLIRLTPKGIVAQNAYRELLRVIETRWHMQFGKDEIGNLREALEPLVGAPSGQRSPLFQGIKPYPDGWRASVRTPETLPHYPMVLHRGGYPDGS